MHHQDQIITFNAPQFEEMVTRLHNDVYDHEPDQAAIDMIAKTNDDLVTLHKCRIYDVPADVILLAFPPDQEIDEHKLALAYKDHIIPILRSMP